MVRNMADDAAPQIRSAWTDTARDLDANAADHEVDRNLRVRSEGGDPMLSALLAADILRLPNRPRTETRKTRLVFVI